LADTRLPLIFGHRGASAAAPENSLSAFALAITQGADGVECDVHLTADGQIVILHDDTVDATTDGHGPIASLTLAEARKLTLRPRGGANPAGTTAEHIPTLAEVLERFGHGPTVLNVEIKQMATTDLAEATARVVEEHGAAQMVLLSSFDTKALAYLQRNHPNLRRALLFPPSIRAGVMAGLLGSSRWIMQAQRLGCVAIHPLWRLATTGMIARAHALGMSVNVWTADDEATARRLAELHVDGIITNDPMRVRRALSPS
jgi:glycerophosphoryl diester phosphodiesterase